MGRLTVLRGAALLVVLWVLPLASPNAQQVTPRARIDEAAALLKNQKARDALTLLQAIAADPGTAADLSLNALVLFQLGQAHLQLNDYPQALDAYDRARTASRTAGDRSTEAACVIGLAVARKTRGEYQASIALGEEALRLYESLRDSEGSARAWQHIGAIQDLTGRHREALASYQAARRSYGNSRRLGRRAGRIHPLNLDPGAPRDDRIARR
jgi:tetratricopeptide (TPR) repeat protein